MENTEAEEKERVKRTGKLTVRTSASHREGQHSTEGVVSEEKATDPARPLLRFACCVLRGSKKREVLFSCVGILCVNMKPVSSSSQYVACALFS